MSKKNNIRSFRYSDEVAAILVNFGVPGGSLNDKFEQLILHCNFALPEVDKQISLKKKQLDKLCDEYADLQRKTYNQKELARELEALIANCHRLKKQLADTFDKL